MRLRNIPRAEQVLAASPFVVKDEKKKKGNWNLRVFEGDAPIHIEIGMGKGRFLTTLARENPRIHYVGIERYASVLLRAVEKTEEGEETGCLSNLRFLCMDAAGITEVFAPGEVDRIYLNFSDPWPKARHAGRRLTSQAYLARYDAILAEGGRLEFKTDNRALFDFSVEQIETSGCFELTACTYDLYRDPELSRGNVMTEYEEKFSSLGNPICKLIARRKTGRR